MPLYTVVVCSSCGRSIMKGETRASSKVSGEVYCYPCYYEYLEEAAKRESVKMDPNSCELTTWEQRVKNIME